MHARRLSLLIGGLFVASVACGGQGPRHQGQVAPPPVPITFSSTISPPGVNVVGAEWVTIRGVGGIANNAQLAAVFRPLGQGPFPLVITLHGGEGFSEPVVAWSARLAAAGFVVVAGCWQASSAPPNTIQFYEQTVTLIACPRMLATPVSAIAALIALGGKQPGARTDAIGLYAYSSGGRPALDALLARRDIRTVVLDSSATSKYLPEPSTINAPILVLAGTADDYVDFRAQKSYVEALRQAGKDVEWHYYDGGRHVMIADPANKDDATRRIIDFLNRRLTYSSI